MNLSRIFCVGGRGLRGCSFVACGMGPLYEAQKPVVVGGGHGICYLKKAVKKDRGQIILNKISPILIFILN